MKELIKKFLFKVGLGKESEPSATVEMEVDAETQDDNKAKGDEREKTSPKEPPVAKPYHRQELVAHRLQTAQVHLSFGHSSAYLVLRL